MDNNYNKDIWQQSAPPPTQEQPQKPNYDNTSLILGFVSVILALVGSCLTCCVPLVFITGFIGIILVFVTNKNGYPWNAMRIAALILNIVSILGLILWLLCINLFINSAAGQAFIEEYMNIFNEFLADPSFSGSYYE